MRYRLMPAERGSYPVKLMARILGVSRSGCCAWLSKGCPEDDWSGMREAVRRVWLESDLVRRDFTTAKSRGYVAGNAIFHSDEGAQYASRLLAEWARGNDVRLSCSRTGNCHDNAVAESFFATLKNEMHYRESFATSDAEKAAVVEFIESYCNRRRPHSSIGSRIPAEAMEAFFERTDPEGEAAAMAA